MGREAGRGGGPGGAWGGWGAGPVGGGGCGLVEAAGGRRDSMVLLAGRRVVDGDCWGDYGHCDVPSEPLHQFDRRHPHPLRPININVEITEALRTLGKVEEVRVTALVHSVDPDKRADPLRFARLTL